MALSWRSGRLSRKKRHETILKPETRVHTLGCLVKFRQNCLIQRRDQSPPRGWGDVEDRPAGVRTLGLNARRPP